MTDSFFNFDDIKNAVMTKPEMYAALSGQTVKCIYVENEGLGMFAVQNIKDNHTYILDSIKTK